MARLSKTNSLLIGITFFLFTSNASANIERCLISSGMSPDCDRCSGNWYIFQGETKRMEFFGNWLDLTDYINSGEKISTEIIWKKNGFENLMRGYGLIGSINIKFSASTDAKIGARKITLKRGDDNDTFYLRVLPRPLIHDVTVDPLEGPFSEATVTITGDGLQNPIIQEYAEYVSDPNYPIILGDGVRYADYGRPGPVNLPIVRPQILSYSNNYTKIKLTFGESLLECAVDIVLRSNRWCDPLSAPGNAPNGRHLIRVHLKARPYPFNKPNYVHEIKFMTDDNSPPQTAFNVRERFFARVKFKRPGRYCLTWDKTKEKGPLPLPAGTPFNPQLKGCDYFYWRMIQPQDFQGVSPTTYDPNSYNKVLIPAGDYKVDLYMVAPNNPEGCQGSTERETNCNVWIETWVGNTNTTTGDEYKKALFNIKIPAR